MHAPNMQMAQPVMAQPVMAQSQPMLISVQVPQGMVGGMILQVETPAGLMQVQIPQGLNPGQTFQMQVPMPARPPMLPVPPVLAGETIVTTMGDARRRAVSAESQLHGGDPMRQALDRLAQLTKSASDDNGNDNDNGPDRSNSTCLQLFFLCASAGFVALSVVPWLNAQADTGSLFFTPPWPPLPPPLAPLAPPPMLYTENGCQCANTCQYASDGSCDDGGPQSAYDICGLGYDCTDCGGRCLPPPSPPRLPPQPPFAPLPSRPSLPPAHPPRPPSATSAFGVFKTFEEYRAALIVPVLSTFIFFVFLILRQCCVRNQGEVTRGEGFGSCLCVLSTLALIVIVTIGWVDPNFDQRWKIPESSLGILFGVMTIPVCCLLCMGRDRRNRVLNRVEMVEGDLLKFLAAGIIRLVSVTWLLSQPPDWIAVRRQVSQAIHQL